uniref:Uncharacterized protein n=1 Tax=Artemia franciscana TaxID=6661 RepID=B5TMC5_ARTSF|nr:hypothetical protein [Artemia franciscana]
MNQVFCAIFCLSISVSACIAGGIDSSINTEPEQRFLFATKTVTNLVITTTTTTSALDSWCYRLVNQLVPITTNVVFPSEEITEYLPETTIVAGDIGLCRRRRWAFEDAFAESLPTDQNPSVLTNSESFPTALDAISKKEDEADIDIGNGENNNNPRFGLSLIHTVTQTLTAVSKHISTTRFRTVLLTCTPAHLGIHAC